MTAILDSMIEAHENLINKVVKGEVLSKAQRGVLKKIESAPAFKDQKARYEKNC